MRSLVLGLFVVLVAVGVAGVRAESAPRSAPTKSAPNSYSQEVNNTTEDRFEADESWGTSSYRRDASRGESYRFARPSGDGADARFKVKIPEPADYAVYARWPEVKGLNDSVPVGVETTSGLEWTKVDQQRDGGRWVRIGVFEMAAGDDYAVRFSPGTNGEGYVAADAVKVVKVSSGTAPSRSPESDGPAGGTTRPAETKGQDGTVGQDVVKEARTYMGVPYRLGRTSRSGVDCSGFTMLVYRKFGVSLPHDVERQSRYGSRVSGSPQAGDLVFFDEHGDGLSHVGIATGRGTIIHSSDYWRKVTETQIKYIKGYKGAKRLLR